MNLSLLGFWRGGRLLQRRQASGEGVGYQYIFFSE